MSKLILDMAVSLDGFVAGKNDADAGLHNWYFSPSTRNKELIDDLITTTGAIIMGRRSYDMGDEYDGFVDNPYQVPHFVITHNPPTSVAKGTTQFIFVTDGIKNLVSKAKDLADTKNVIFGGGANVAQQLLKAGLLDEIHIHLVPILLGEGISLWDDLGIEPIQLENIQVIETKDVTHLKFRIVK